MGAPACADGPGGEFQLLEDETVTSPDRLVRVEQYATDLGDEGYLHQFWAFDSDHQHGSLLNPGEGTDLAGYPAGFRFSPDSQWLVRMQKLGAGYQTLFLYRRDRVRLSSATAKPLGDLAWDYFFSLPVSKRMHRNPKDRYSLRSRAGHPAQGAGRELRVAGTALARQPLPRDQPLFRRPRRRKALPMDRRLALPV